jgi:transposase
LEAYRSEIEVHYLPSYSPDLNSDEGINADLKQALPRREPARSKEQLRQAADRHMRSLSRRPQRIRATFQHPQFRYAA